MLLRFFVVDNKYVIKIDYSINEYFFFKTTINCILCMTNGSLLNQYLLGQEISSINRTIVITFSVFFFFFFFFC